MKKGIAVAGNMIVDITYPINGWPRQGELVHIQDGISRTTGGAVCNVLVDLAWLDGKLPLRALGRVGRDAEGDLLLSELAKYDNIDASGVVREGISAFTLVMSDQQSKQRTFFTYLGANGEFSEADIDWSSLDVDILHIGYILLLNALDQGDGECGSKMARLLRDAQRHGIKTSIDVVSEASDRFQKLVVPALKYADYCIINEYEAEMTTGVKLRDENGALIAQNLPAALRKMKALGVSTWAVIHCPEGGFGMDEGDNYVPVEGLRLPEGYIKGTVGAGDAFCSGVLYGAWKGMGLAEAIELGTAAAACSLSQPGATEGMRDLESAMALYRSLKEGK